ncbi:MAG: hypothetical protein JF887_13070 [Candidatus Dormibacteraeota bacterium]|uniref:Uncharacterized protein n=1 Tax=Candidatus Amunia macphersoniae TaxID=3127014 RepID=A0A934NJX8_9BACT|nr:hypothetical protein [Candidatus Dormibacteraeota bacterium]
MTQEQIQVYAVVRHDRFQQSADPQVAISVKEVLPTLEAAEAEVSRLRALQESKDVDYFWQATRWFPSGRARRRSGAAGLSGRPPTAPG